MRAVVAFFAAVLFGSVGGVAWAEPLQPLVDAAQAGSVLRPAPGVYSGPVVINKSLTIDGGGKVTINGGGKGSVVTIKGDEIVLQNLHITGSGEAYSETDSGINVEGRYNSIVNNDIDDCLFGINLQKSDNNIIRGNRVSSKKHLGLGLKGDGIAIWYSHNNKIVDNNVSHSRDTVAWYSNNNIFNNNTIHSSRYGLHFMHSNDNRVENNHIYENSVGLSMMYGNGLIMRRNHIRQSVGATGTCVGIKEASGVNIIDNDIYYCAMGIFLDLSPFDPEMRNLIQGNRIAFNDVGIGFLNDWEGNEIKDNRFRGNITQVQVEGAGSAKRNEWSGNFWDDYEGFDRDRDGRGDVPYRSYAYAGRVWMDVPPARFFKATPLLEAVDFLEKLAPFSEPLLLMEDKSPRLPGSKVEALTFDPDAGRYDPFGLRSGK
jgi:nitrous oxidase accessory protein